MLEINPVFGSFAIIAAVTLLPCTEGRSFLAGEDTPVWTARCRHFGGCDKDNNKIEYKRLNKNIIQTALNYRKSNRFQQLSFRTSKYTRSIEEDYADYEDESYGMYRSENREKKVYNILDKVQYGTVVASILVMVDYDASAVKNQTSRRRFVKERILYTLAYWNSFNTKVWDIKGIRYMSHVQVKLVGIIIGLDRGATPYISSSDTDQTCLKKANEFWRNPPNKSEFPRDSYHAVATMTDVKPYGSYGIFDAVADDDDSSPSVIVWDYLNFWSLLNKGPRLYQRVGDSLRNWAYYYPKVYGHMQPGRTIERILPGMLMSPLQQCVLYGWENVDRTCPEYSEDCNLYCLNKGFLRFCSLAGPALDGTPCKVGVVG